MIFILATRALILLANAGAAVKNAVTTLTDSSKARSTCIVLKHSSQKQHTITTIGALREAVLRQLRNTHSRSHQLLLTKHAHNAPPPHATRKDYQAAFYKIVQDIVCAGLVRQHAILHLNLPEDLIAGFVVDFRVLMHVGIFIPGFEQFQMEDLTPAGPYEEPIYCKRFRLAVDFRVLQGAGILSPGFEKCQLLEDFAPPGPHEEPLYVKPFARANRPRHIDFAPAKPSAEEVREFQQAKWVNVGKVDLRKLIDVY